MAYLPKNKYKVLYTNGDTFEFQNTGKAYTGEYIKLVDGRIFAGKNPNDLKGKLVPIKQLLNNNILTNEINNRTYQLLDKKRARKQNSYIPIPSSKPIPTPVDYGKEYFNRYLSVRLNTKEYQEISKDTYDNFSKRPYNNILNKVFFIKWALTDDNEIKNATRLGDLEQTLPGIFNFFDDKKEYGVNNGVIRINPTTRIYINGENIDKNLPAAYQIGNKNPNNIDNPNIPKNQYCGNCISNKKDYCTRWEANIRNNFWCKSYNGKVNQPPKVEQETISMVKTITPDIERSGY